MAMSPRTLRPRASAGYGLDAADWRSRVLANSGTVSASTMKAVDDFCKAIVTNGLRDRMYRVNLFCGNDLNACLVPLFRGPDRTGTQFGNATDTNVGIVSGDYQETGAGGGLAGGSSTKALQTGFVASNLPTTDSAHFSAYIQTDAVGTYFGANGNILNVAASTFTRPVFSWGGAINPASSYDLEPSHFIGSRTSTTLIETYVDGVSVSSSATAQAALPAERVVTVFGTTASTGLATPNSGAIKASGYSIGIGLNSTQAAAFYTAMQAFQTALGRQV